MLSEEDAAAIKKAAMRTFLDNCEAFNGKIDQDRLPEAVAKAIAEAIRQYDRMKS